MRELEKDDFLRIRETLIKAKLYKYKKTCVEQVTINMYSKQETSVHSLDYSDSVLTDL